MQILVVKVGIFAAVIMMLCSYRRRPARETAWLPVKEIGDAMLVNLTSPKLQR
jgi:hypothetical protein